MHLKHLSWLRCVLELKGLWCRSFCLPRLNLRVPMFSCCPWIVCLWPALLSHRSQWAASLRWLHSLQFIVQSMAACWKPRPSSTSMLLLSCFVFPDKSCSKLQGFKQSMHYHHPLPPRSREDVCLLPWMKNKSMCCTCFALHARCNWRLTGQIC